MEYLVAYLFAGFVISLLRSIYLALDELEDDAVWALLIQILWLPFLTYRLFRSVRDES
jgi:hypothetical protein